MNIRVMTIEDYDQVHALWMRSMDSEYEVWMIRKKA